MAINESRLPLRRSDRDLLKRGRMAGGPTKASAPKTNGYGEDVPGTSGISDMGAVIRLVHRMRQQRWGRPEIRDALLDPTHAGGVWLRRQEDPDAWLDRLIEQCPEQKPYIPMGRRHSMILAALAGGRMRQGQLLKAIGHANKGHMLDDLKTLAAAGALRIEPEQHGQVTWYWIELADPEIATFEAASRRIRNDLARLIARRRRHVAPGGHRTSRRDRQAWRSERVEPQRPPGNLDDAAVRQILRDLEPESGPSGSADSPSRDELLRVKARYLLLAHPQMLPWRAEEAHAAAIRAKNKIVLRRPDSWEGGEIVAVSQPWPQQPRHQWRGGRFVGRLLPTRRTELSTPQWWTDNAELIAEADRLRQHSEWAALQQFHQQTADEVVEDVLGPSSCAPRDTTASAPTTGRSESDDLTAILS